MPSSPRTPAADLPASVVEARFDALIGQYAAETVVAMLERPAQVGDYQLLETLRSRPMPDTASALAFLAATRRMVPFQQARDLRALLALIGREHEALPMRDRQLFHSIAASTGRSKESVEGEAYRARWLDAHFPALLDALEAGMTTLQHCWTIVDATFGLQDVDILATIARLALPAALVANLRDFRATVNELVTLHDPSAPERRARAKRARGVTVVRLGDGVSMLQIVDADETVTAMKGVIDDAAVQARRAQRAERRASTRAAAEKAAAEKAAADAAAEAAAGQPSTSGAEADDATDEPADVEPADVEQPGPAEPTDESATDAPPATDGPAHEPATPKPMPWGELRASCAAAFFLGRRGSDGSMEWDEKAATQVHVSIAIDARTLAEVEDNLARQGRDPLVAGVARALCVRPDLIRRVLTDPKRGHLLDYGSAVYLPRPVRSHDYHRDGHRCRCCGRRLTAGEMDHLTDFRLGGPSSADNTWLLCPECHQRKTAGLITVTGDAGGPVEVTLDTGITFISRPPAFLPVPERDAILHAGAEPVRFTARPPAPGSARPDPELPSPLHPADDAAHSEVWDEEPPPF
jgi:hypothetical protein